MESKLVQNFVKSVNELITSEKERDALFEALKTYQSASDVRKLIQDLKRLLNDPSKLEVYDFIRPLIRPQHQQQYDKLAPNPPSQRLRIIKLRKRANESFGFAVRGGLEHGVGIFVSHVEPGSQADQKGLKMGDEIVRVNGFTIAEAIHEEVLNLIKGQDEIELKVNNIGMVPIKQKPTDTVTWQYVDKPGLGKSQGSAEETREENLVKIFINLRGATSMGCSIISGPKTYPGIFIETVRPGSLGEDYGLQAGDQIMEVNGKSFLNIKHQEAIVEIKGSKELNMVIKKGVGLQLLNLKKKESGGSPMVDKREPRPVTQEEESEILEEDQHAVEERRHWEMEHERLKKQKAEEEVRERYRQNEMKRQMEEEERRELEEEQRRLQEERIRKEEEQRQKLERLRLEKEAAAREEERKNEEKRKREEQARKEEEKRKKQEEEEEKRRQEVLAKKQQSAVLAGRAGPTNSKKPTLLGAAPGAQTSFGKSSSKKVKEVVVVLDEGNPTLDIELEGGSDSPIGKIVIADVYPNGSVDKNGEIKRGDQVLKINDKSLEGLSITEANEVLWQAEQDCLPGDSVKFVVVESEIRHDEMTYTVPSSDLDHLDIVVEMERIDSYNDYTAFTDDFNFHNSQNTHNETQDDSSNVNSAPSDHNGFYGNRTRSYEVSDEDSVQLPTNCVGSSFQETSDSPVHSLKNSLDHSHELEINFKENFILTNSFDCFKQSPIDSFHFNGRRETVSNIFQNFENENKKFHRDWMHKLVNERSLLSTIDSDTALIETDKSLLAMLDNSGHHEYNSDKSSVRSVENLPITYIH